MTWRPLVVCRAGAQTLCCCCCRCCWCRCSPQVHAAVLKGSNKDVVIKVIKPGVEDVLTTGEPTHSSPSPTCSRTSSPSPNLQAEWALHGRQRLPNLSRLPACLSLVGAPPLLAYSNCRPQLSLPVRPLPGVYQPGALPHLPLRWGACAPSRRCCTWRAVSPTGAGQMHPSHAKHCP